MSVRYTIIISGLVLSLMIGSLLFGEQLFRLLPGKKNDLARNRHARLDAIMKDPAHYRSFHDKYQRFYERMTPQQRDDLRKLRKKIDSDPQGPALNRELASYYDWLKTVPFEKAGIDEAETIEERLKIIGEVRENQKYPYSDNGSKLPDNDDLDQVKDEPTDSDLAKTLESMDTSRRLKFLGYLPANFLREIRLEYMKSRVEPSENHTN